MDTQIKKMKLIFTRDENNWYKRIEDLQGNLILEEVNPIVHELTQEYFDDWETMTKSIPVFNIVEVERFL